MESVIEIILCTIKNSSKENITNGLILDLYEKIGKTKRYKYQDIVQHLNEDCTFDQFRGRVASLKKLKKSL